MSSSLSLGGISEREDGGAWHVEGEKPEAERTTPENISSEF